MLRRSARPRSRGGRVWIMKYQCEELLALADQRTESPTTCKTIRAHKRNRTRSAAGSAPPLPCGNALPHTRPIKAENGMSARPTSDSTRHTRSVAVYWSLQSHRQYLRVAQDRLT